MKKIFVFFKLNITKNHSWCNKLLKECVTPKDFLIVLIMHDGKASAPNGNSIILENNSLICCAPSFNSDEEGFVLSEINVIKNLPFINKHIYETELHKVTLIVLIKRNGNNIVPNGMTVILEKVTLVTLNINKSI